jgi:hypothetical protein
MIQFQDSVAPLLDVYEQAIYLYLFRHSRLIGEEEVMMSFKSARARLATGVGEGGRPMSESTNQKRLLSLQEKGLITIVRTTHKGRLFKVHLPSEIAKMAVPVDDPEPAQNPETIDFFTVAEHRQMLLEREGHRCFYTLKPLTKDSFIVEHVVSRPDGDNSYRNCVAASREVNNKKGASSAEDFLRRLFREGYLNEQEFEDRIEALGQLKAGKLQPKHPSFISAIASN